MAAPVDPPAPEATTPPAAPAPAAPQPGPWAADVAEYFGDNAEAAAAADRYMREKVQPERTRYEQETLPARELFKDLLEKPEETLAEVVAELYGQERPDVVKKFAAIFAEGEPAPVTPAEPAAPSSLSADEKEDLAWARAERQRKADEAATAAQAEEYATTITELRTAHPDLTDADVDLIHPFIAAAGGDTEVAHAGYQAFTEQFKARHGVAPTAAPVTPEAPAVLGATAAAAAVPPTTKTYKNLDEAMDDFFAEQHASTPTVVGAV